METQVRKKVIYNSGGAGAAYGLGFIGASIYYLQLASGFWMGALGLVKASVWPVFLVYKLFEFLKM